MRTALLALIALLLPGTAGAAARALLVGVSAYPEASPLPGVAHDVAGMHTLLRGLGVAEADVLVLTEAAATRDGLLAAIEQHLVRGVQPEDRILLYFAGHGYRLPAAPGSAPEEDGLDEILVLWDWSPHPSPIGFVRDDELDAALARSAAGEQIVILDSCHSGSADRAVYVSRGLAPRDFAEVADEPDSGPVMDCPAEDVVVSQSGDRRVTLSAARSCERALEQDLPWGPQTQRHGLFTWHLLRGLAGAADSDGDGTVGYGELAAYLGWSVRLRAPQNPVTMLPAGLQDSPFFGLVGAALPSQVTASRGRRITLARRAGFDFSEGDPLSLLDASGAVVGRGTLERASDASLVLRLAEGRAPVGALALHQRSALAAGPLFDVRLEGLAEPLHAQALKLLDAHPDYQIAGPTMLPGATVRAARGGGIRIDGGPASRPRICDVEGGLVGAAASCLLDELRARQIHRRLADLLDGGQRPEGLEVESVGGTTLRVGEPFVAQIDGGTGGHLLLFHVSARGDVVVFGGAGGGLAYDRSLRVDQVDGEPLRVHEPLGVELLVGLARSSSWPLPVPCTVKGDAHVYPATASAGCADARLFLDVLQTQLGSAGRDLWLDRGAPVGDVTVLEIVR